MQSPLLQATPKHAQDTYHRQDKGPPVCLFLYPTKIAVIPEGTGQPASKHRSTFSHQDTTDSQCFTMPVSRNTWCGLSTCAAMPELRIAGRWSAAWLPASQHGLVALKKDLMPIWAPDALLPAAPSLGRTAGLPAPAEVWAACAHPNGRSLSALLVHCIHHLVTTGRPSKARWLPQLDAKLVAVGKDEGPLETFDFHRKQ
jgi:hypothetical protein